MTDIPDDEDEGSYFGEDDEPLLGGGLFSVIDGGLTPTALDVELCSLPQNDLANALRMSKRHPGAMWFTKEWGWGVWDDRRHDFDQGGALVGRMAQDVARRMLSHEAGAFYATRRGKAETKKDFDKRAGQFWSWCLQAGNNSRTEAMLKQLERSLTRPLSDFDSDPDRLTVANGVIVLPQDGSPPRFEAAHESERLVTKVAGAAYDPKARCVAFEAFLEKMMPDPEMRAFLARVIGYCLTGHIGEQAYFIFQGKGGDGKSTFLNAIEGMLGGFVANAAIDTFLHREKKGNDHSADIARLASGVRLVKAAEPEQGARMAESVIKTITGGEPMVARAMYREPFEFTPRWKLIISCNRKPQIRGDDRGIWRRTLVVPWPVSLAKEEMDQHMGERLRAEAPGILNWALAGWADWLEHGLSPPAAVLEAVEAYRLSSNPFGVWFDTCLDLDEGGREKSRDLYASYKGWANEGEFEPMSRTAFGRALAERGLGRASSNGIVWTGARLNLAGVEAQKAFSAAEEDRQYGDRRGA